jgi:hypothetical protein
MAAMRVWAAWWCFGFIGLGWVGLMIRLKASPAAGLQCGLRKLRV